MEEKYFNIAFKEAIKAYNKNEIPVGTIIVKNDKIIAKSYNNRQQKYNVLGHSEINAILKAEKKIKDWRLDGCIMYVTLKPCEMCQCIIKEARITKVIYLLDQPNINDDMKNSSQTNKCLELKNEYEKLMKKFFNKMRNN